MLTLVHTKNDDVRGLSNPPSALLTSLRLTVPRVLHLSLGSREKNRVVNFEAHALRRHEHAAFADQRLEPPQLSQTLSASPRAAAIDRAASTVPETHGSAGSHAELSPAVGARPRLTLVHAEHSLTVLGVAQDAQTTTRGAGRKRPVDAGEAVLRMCGTDRLQSASSRPRMGRSPTSFRLLPSVSGGLLSHSADSGVRGNLGRAGGQRVAAARG